MVIETVKLIDTVNKMYPVAQFFKNRYFPDAGCFYSEKALIEMRRGNRKVAPFVAPIANGIVLDKQGYTAEYVDAPYIAPKMPITPADLEKKAFGEKPDSGRTPAQRENELEAECLDDLRSSILRRHELMCTQIITTGEVQMKHFSTASDAVADKNGVMKVLRFYNNTDGFKNKYKFDKDFKTMTAQEKIIELYKMALILKKRGVTTSDIVMTGDVSMLLMTDEKFLEFYNKKAVETGEIKQSELPDGVSYNGSININGILFKMFTYENQYEDLDGKTKDFLPAGTIAFLQPGMGKTVYAQVTFANGTGFESHADKIVPHVVVSGTDNLMMIHAFSRPVPYPKDPEGWLVANINDEISEMSLNEDNALPVSDGAVDLKSEDEINSMTKDTLFKYGQSIGAPVTTTMKLDELKAAVIEYQKSIE